MHSQISPEPGAAAPAASARTGKLPLGIILIIIFVSLGILGSLSSLTHSSAAIGLLVITGVAAYGYNLVQLAVQVSLLVGLIKRKKWGRRLGIFWYACSIVVAGISLLGFVFNREAALEAMEAVRPGTIGEMPQGFLVLGAYIGMGLAIILCALILGYLLRKKEYFGP